MEAIWISTGIVALAEIGDKTQLLAIVLAARFGKPWPILAGILCATLLNHAAAATAGYFAALWLGGRGFELAVGAGFLAMAAWALVPDKQDEKSGAESQSGIFLTTLIAFFLVEMGDKTQIATTLLAARFHDIVFVTLGTTLGMMLANAPAVMLGKAITRIVQLRMIRLAAAIGFAAIGLWVLANAVF